MNKIRYIIFGLSLLVLSFVQGCNKTSSSNWTIKKTYHLNILHAGWDTVVYINGNPVYRGGSSFSVVKDLTTWLKKGSNAVRIVTKRVSESIIASRCEIRFLQMTQGEPYSAEILDGIRYSPAEQDNYEFEFTVDCDNNTSWLWQNTDAISTVTDSDKKIISNLIKSLAVAFNKKDADSIFDQLIPVWGKEQCPEELLPPNIDCTDIKISAKKQLNQIFEYQDYTVTVSDENDWEYFYGKNTVMVSMKPVTDPQISNNIIYAGHNNKKISNKMTFSISYNSIHFVKLNNEWSMLIP